MADMNPFEWALRPIKRYADFSGRAPRAEYWWYMLAITLLGFLTEYVDELAGGAIVGMFGPVTLVVELGLFVPGLAVLVRRLHDINRSGLWALLNIGSYLFVAVGFVTTDFEAMFKDLESVGIAALLALVLAWTISMIALLVFTVTRGDEGSNSYGPDPYGPNLLEEVFA